MQPDCFPLWFSEERILISDTQYYFFSIGAIKTKLHILFVNIDLISGE